MKLELAILNVLAASPRAIPVGVIAGMVPAFTGRAATETDLTRLLRQMEREGDVRGTENRDHGTMWKETDDGRLRI